jgi:hypothetical protein
MLKKTQQTNKQNKKKAKQKTKTKNPKYINYTENGQR